MATIQGEFATAEQGRRAMEALRAAGVPAANVRMWNIIPEAPPGRPTGGGSVRRGAIVGALAGGLLGAAIGAGIGRAVGEQPADPLPAVSGARVVVDVLPAGPDVAAILREHGAVNVR
jgi:hypothetical protein